MNILTKITDILKYLLNHDTNPTGTILAFAGNTIPNGYLLCDGSEISRITYSNLFAIIGESYGSGDGETTFNLPNLIGRFLEGGNNTNVGTVKNAGLPNIEGYFNEGCINDGYGGGAINKYAGTYTNGGGSGGDSFVRASWSFNASLSNPIYGNSTTVQPPAIICNYVIKY